ncbi:TRAM domain-containing protein, partial [Mitsuokella multacida]
MKHKVPVEKGKSYEIEIRTLGTSGEGVGRYEEFTVFVPGALPG